MIKDVVVDASTLAAIAFGEPAGGAVVRQLEGTSVNAPALLKFELANIAWKKMRRHSSESAAILRALRRTLSDRTGIVWHDVDHADVVLVAHASGLSAYDASYLWLAAFLGADLVTLDEGLARAGAELAI